MVSMMRPTKNSKIFQEMGLAKTGAKKPSQIAKREEKTKRGKTNS